MDCNETLVFGIGLKTLNFLKNWGGTPYMKKPNNVDLVWNLTQSNSLLKKQKKENEENLNFELYVNNWDQNYYF